MSGIDVIEEISQRLRGYIFDFRKDQWVKSDYARPLMSESGICEIRTWLNAYVNKNSLLSYFEPDEISKLLMGLEKSLTFKIEYGWDDMGIRKEDADIVFRIISDMVWAAVNRARYGGEKQFLENTEQRKIVTADAQKSGGQLLSSIPILGNVMGGKN